MGRKESNQTKKKVPFYNLNVKSSYGNAKSINPDPDPCLHCCKNIFIGIL